MRSGDAVSSTVQSRISVQAKKKTDTVSRSGMCKGTRHAVTIELKWGTKGIS